MVEWREVPLELPHFTNSKRFFSGIDRGGGWNRGLGDRSLPGKMANEMVAVLSYHAV